MIDFPNLNQYGYKIIDQLGANQIGGRITWKAENLISQEVVVIKQFRFATKNSSWSGYKAYEQELKILEQLNHPGIPKYLDGIETSDGFCLIQEYISACSLNNYNIFSVAEVQQIAFKVLDVLIYLQQQHLPIVHGDLQPENILVDENLAVYLIDFGFSSLSDQEISQSFTVRGTPGFMAPEQLTKPTLASDLYSLGVTLICLLSNQSIVDIQDSRSADNPNQLDLNSLLPELDWYFLDWLENMTQVQTSNRFSNALVARNALLKIDLSDATRKNVNLKTNVTNNNIPKSQLIAGTSGIVGLSGITVWSINFVNHHVNLTAINIAIAILASVVVSIAELSAIEIAQFDSQAKVPGIALGIGTPILLVAGSGFIWGISEAVNIATTIIIAELLILCYFWWRIFDLSPKSIKLKVSLLFAALFLGISLGLQLI